ncbi:MULTISPECIES: hypothetical protein [Streptococcus]|uniref:hypothetical protein n=2 Tax=Streptococcus TaxID=1301 RepID=UPI000CF5E1F5|nr:hypothetical protein [Streptococcus suis]MBM7312017.1 hypothetical protein [Streptococcus suis]MBM7318614.1 hypothetical protein [Streptococcus suis]MBY4964198.1 hypothetical protein [Streptococcus suis]TII10048.1 hypothetical protein FAJ40_05380 [Streptococcus suis]
MRRYRLEITKFGFPIIFIIWLGSTIFLWQMILDFFRRKKEAGISVPSLVSTALIIVTVAFIVFFTLSFYILLRPPRTGRQGRSLKEVLAYESRKEDVVESEGQSLIRKTTYRLEAKRVYCPACGKPAEGLFDTIITCVSCGHSYRIE